MFGEFVPFFKIFSDNFLIIQFKVRYNFLFVFIDKLSDNKMSILSNLNKFVRSFLSDNEEILSEWNSKQTQSDVKSLFKSITRHHRKKDPNAPKRAKSGYLFFCQDTRQEVVNENPDMKNTEVIRELGRQWQALDSRSKTKFNKMANKDKSRYEKEMQSYTPPEITNEDRGTRSTRRKKDPNAPKRPKSSYLFFCQDERAVVISENPVMKNTDIIRELGRRWKDLDEDSKYQFSQQAEEDKTRYDSEMALYNPARVASISTTQSTTTTTTQPTKRSATTTTTTKAPTKAPTKQATRKQTGYQLFVSENRSEVETDNPELKAKEINTVLREMWGELDTEDQQEYKNRC